MVLNAAVAEVHRFCRKARKAIAKGDSPIEAAMAIASAAWKAHKRIVFNGNGYSAEWIKEAAYAACPCSSQRSRRFGIHEGIQCRDAVQCWGSMAKAEAESRCIIYLERYAKQVIIEREWRWIWPDATCSLRHRRAPMSTPARRRAWRPSGATSVAQEQAGSPTGVAHGPPHRGIGQAGDRPERRTRGRRTRSRAQSRTATACGPENDDLRIVCDELERLMPKSDWPFPSYEDLLYSL